jgi:hypothetical protein
VEDEFWVQFGPGAVGVGWDGDVLGLTLHLTDPAALPEREAVEAWQGRRRLAPHLLARAHVRAGT